MWYDYGPNEPCESPANDRWTYHHHTKVMYGDTATKNFIKRMMEGMGIMWDYRET